MLPNFLYALGVMFCLSVIVVWWNGTYHDPLATTAEEDTLFVAACGFCVFPVLNFIAGGLLLWHVLKRQGKL